MAEIRCDECGAVAAVELRYAHARMCPGCFTSFFEERVRKTVRENGLFTRKERIVVALSGGKDSVVLLKLLHDAFDGSRGITLAALTIDEGIAGYREKTLASARKVCADLGVEHHVHSIREEFGLSLDEIMAAVGGRVPACSFCGVLRRRMLNDLARRLSATKVATGHNLDDEVQTSFMNFVRGDVARIARLGARVGFVSDKRFVPRVKPLRDTPEREVALYALFKGLPTGFDECPFSRRAFRVYVRDLLNDAEEERPGTKLALLSSTDRLVGLVRRAQVRGVIGSCVKCGEPSSSGVCKVCVMLDGFSRLRRR